MFDVNAITGDLKLHQGEWGEYIVEDIAENKEGMRAYFEIQDSKRKRVGDQIKSVVTGGSVTFVFTPPLTNLLTVKLSEDEAEYYGGIKFCDDSGREESVKVGNKQDGERIIITVLPIEAEGDLNG